MFFSFMNIIKQTSLYPGCGMGNNMGYMRAFYIFTCEDMIFKGFGRASGYLRIIRNGPEARALLNLTNFEIDGNAEHDIIFIFDKPGRPEEFPLFKSYRLKVESGRVQEEFSLNERQILGGDFSLENLWGVVIYTRIQGEYSAREYFPLKSIKNENRPWREPLLKKIRQRQEGKIKTGVLEMPSDEEVVGRNSEDFVKRAVEEIYKNPTEPQVKHSVMAPGIQEDNQAEEELQEASMASTDSDKHEELTETAALPAEEASDSPVSEFDSQETDLEPENGQDALEVNKSQADGENKIDTIFDMHFEKYDPFGTTNPRYRWWKSSDMRKINEILGEIGINIPFELSKEGYVACEAYGHVLIGIYSDRRTSRDFIIIGIPAENRQSAGNYHNNSRWEDSEAGYTPAGYWLTYIDLKNSNVVKAAN